MVDLDEFGRMPKDVLLIIAKNEKNKRKQLGISQAELSTRADVSLPSLRMFEQKGEISLSSLVKIATALGDQKGFLELFPKMEYKSMQELLDAERKNNRRIRR